MTHKHWCHRPSAHFGDCKCRCGMISATYGRLGWKRPVKKKAKPKKKLKRGVR